MSLYQRSKELAPLAWEPVSCEAIPGLSVRVLAWEAALEEWRSTKAPEGFKAMDDQLHYSEAKQ